MASEKRWLDEFKREIMSAFIIMCKGNDFKKLTLLKIGDTIDSIYEKYSALSSAYAVEVVRCKDCKWRREWLSGGMFYCCNPNYGMASGVELSDDDFCSYGEKSTSKNKSETKCTDLGVSGDENA